MLEKQIPTNDPQKGLNWTVFVTKSLKLWENDRSADRTEKGSYKKMDVHPSGTGDDGREKRFKVRP